MPHRGLQSHPETEEERRRRLEREAREREAKQSLPLPIGPQPIQSFPKPTEKGIPDVKPKTPEVIFDEETGKPTGLIFPDGRTIQNLSPQEINDLTANFLGKRALPAGTVPAGTAQREAEEIARKQELAGTVGDIDTGIASQVEEQGLNVREFLHAGLQNIDLRTAVVAAGGGAAAGIAPAIPTGGVSVVALAAVGGGGAIINDFQKGVRKNIKAQREDLVSVKTKELRQRKLAITNYISAANMNPAAAEDYVLAMGIELSLIRRDYNTLTQRGEEDLEFWGSDATKQIAEYNVFFESVEESLIIRMEQAVLKPDPTRAFIQFEGEES